MDVYVDMDMFVVLHDFDLMAACIASAYFLVKSAPHLFLPEKLKRAIFCTVQLFNLLPQKGTKACVCCFKLPEKSKSAISCAKCHFLIFCTESRKVNFVGKQPKS